MNDFDYVIAGAGLAGLSLAKCLIDSSPDKTLCLIEPRQNYQRDHVWCFWNNAPKSLSVPQKKSWQKWKVRYKGKTNLCSSKRYPYCAVLSEDYYESRISHLEKSPKVNLYFGENVTATEYGSGLVTVKTDQRILSSKVLFDSRPPQTRGNEFKQDFYGLHIRLDKGVFDDSCVTLMDFSGEEVGGGFHFYYLLPFSPTEALVESVYIGLDNFSQEEHHRLVLKHLAQEFGVHTFEQLHIERGCIPMHAISLAQPNPRHYLLGMRAGLVRPSTGYAFAAIHRFSETLAHSLKQNELPSPPETLSKKARLLDTVLLTYLKQRPSDGPMLLNSLFAQVDPDIVVRFLCDNSSLADDSAIVSAMPKKLELGAIMAKTCLL